MKSEAQAGLEEVAQVLRECLEEGFTVDIEAVGTFRSDRDGRIHFVPSRGKRVFLAYAIEDVYTVEALYNQLEAAGFHPWMDRRKLLPGQNWPRAIERAISVSDFFVPCFSRRAAEKPGRFHAELRYALECALERPIGGTYIVPVRLEECPVPRQIAAHIQYVDLFPPCSGGFASLLKTLGATNSASS